MNYNTEYYLNLLNRINKIYGDMLNKKYESFNSLKDIHKELTMLKEEIKTSENEELVKKILSICNEEINLITFLNNEYCKGIDYIRSSFLDVEKMHYEVTNKYITGIILPGDIKDFEKKLIGFKTILYKHNPIEENVMEIAKMKSKVQHFTTEILEDEDVLKIAYENENR